MPPTATTQETGTETPVYTFRKNGREDVQVSLKQYKGRDLIDLRVHFTDNAGVSRPSPKGITLARELLPELEESVRRLKAQLEPAAGGAS